MSRLPGMNPVDIAVPEARPAAKTKEIERKLETVEAQVRPAFASVLAGGNVMGGTTGPMGVTFEFNSGVFHKPLATRVSTYLPGVYYVDLYMYAGNAVAGTMFAAILRRNGASYLEVREWANSLAGYVGSSSGSLIALAEDDYLEIAATHSETSSIRIIDTRLSIFRVGDV